MSTKWRDCTLIKRSWSASAIWWRNRSRCRSARRKSPPLLAKRNDKGELQKKKYGPAMLTGFRWLARLKGVRGTALDIFGRSTERKTERALIGEYRASIDELLGGLEAGNHALAVEIARIPEKIKGFGHVKERNLVAARGQWQELMKQWRAPVMGSVKASSRASSCSGWLKSGAAPGGRSGSSCG